MEKFIAAFATDDGESFIDRHFGDSDFYDIYEISESKVQLLKRIDNTTEDEEGHGDSVKAQGVIGMLKKEGVSMSVSRVFGPNLKRIKKKFLCVIIEDGSIKDSIKKLQHIFPELVVEWVKGEERNFIRL